MYSLGNEIPNIFQIIDDKFYQIVENIANLGTYSVDINTSTWNGSANFIKIFGLPEKELYTVDEFQALVHPEDLERVMGLYADCIVNHKNFDCEYRCIRKDGSLLHVVSRSRIFYDEHDNPVKTVGIKQDITNRKENELLLQKLNDLNTQKNKLLREVAHDHRAPISQVKMVLDLVELGDTEILQELSGKLKTGIDSINEYVEELLEITSIEGLENTFEISEYDLEKLILDEIESFRSKANQAGVELIPRVNSNLMVRMNKTKIKRVISNLITNAIKFSPEGKSVIVEAYRENKTVHINVIDEGVGISRDKLPLIFSGNVTKLKRDGLRGEKSFGIGLTIVKKIIEIHEGTIEVESSPGIRTEFKIQLPVNGPKSVKV